MADDRTKREVRMSDQRISTPKQNGQPSHRQLTKPEMVHIVASPPPSGSELSTQDFEGLVTADPAQAQLPGELGCDPASG
jgi:hypothetical protein